MAEIAQIFKFNEIRYFILETIQSTVFCCLLMLPLTRNVFAHGKLKSYLKMNEVHSKNSRGIEKSQNRKEDQDEMVL